MKLSEKVSWGTREQIGGLYGALLDLPINNGNGDGLWHNEKKSPNTKGDAFQRNALLLGLSSSFKLGLSADDERAKLEAFRASAEARFGEPIVDPNVAWQMKQGPVYAVDKAIALTRLGRTPSQVSEGFVPAAGSVMGVPIAPRELFYQHFHPIGEPTGKVVVLSPGFQETGRDFHAVADALSKKGHDVILMDHQWAGHSDGAPGGIDSARGVARDVAAMTAFANDYVKERHGESGQVKLIGNSMGASAGVLMALTANEADEITLEGPYGQMPKGVDALVIAPFMKATKSPTNDVLQLGSKLPIINKIQAPVVGVPVLSRDGLAQQRAAQNAVVAGTKAQLSAFESVREELEQLGGTIASGGGPKQSHVRLLFTPLDPLAAFDGIKPLAQHLPNKTVEVLGDTEDHTLHHTARGCQHIVDAATALLSS